MPLHYLGMPTPVAHAYRNGGLDAYGQKPERAVSTGNGVPCRHCLNIVPKGEQYLIFAHRPFEGLGPYAETGPVFLCAADCSAPDPNAFPGVLRESPDYLVKGYTGDHRIKYGTGAIVPRDEINAQALEILQAEDVAFVDVRSARNNCWLLRVYAEAQAEHVPNHD